MKKTKPIHKMAAPRTMPIRTIDCIPATYPGRGGRTARNAPSWTGCAHWGQVEPSAQLKAGRFLTNVAILTESGVVSCGVRRANRGKWGLQAWLRSGPCMFSS